MVNIDADHRLDHILHAGDTIRAGDRLYTITGDPIGFGGSSILYPASRSGSELLYAIKECFPGTPVGSFARINGIIRPKSPEDAEATGVLMHFRNRMEAERIIGQRISNTNARAIGIWEVLEPSAIKVDGREYTDVSDGIFAALERMDTKGMTFRQLLEDISQAVSKDHPLRTGSLPKIYTTACMMEQVLLALQGVHKAGYIFGDIQDGNVFFSDCHPENGDIGIGNLLDFGCARELINGERTDPITDACFTTRGFIPPEILDPDKNDGSLTLGPEVDIYSVGCLMLRCLISKFKIRAMGDSPVIGSNTIDGQEARKLGCTESIRKTLNSILRQAMAREPEDRYPSTEAMLEDIRNLKRDTRPPEYLLPPAPGSSESFVEHSRDREIAMFTKALKEKNEVMISGLGGIGKSEIAIQISRSWDSPKGAYFIHYTLSSNEEQEAMEETILRMPLSGYRYEPKKKGMSLEQLRQEEYLERLEILREQYNGALIVIDNFDRPGYTLAQLMQERSYGEVTSLGVKFLFTTRNTIDWAPEWEVGPLSRENLLKLMRRWCTNQKITDEILLELIDEVDGHTLTVDLMAKTLEESWGDITPEMLLEALRSSKLSEGDYPDVDHNAIRKGQETEASCHRELRTEQVYEHLKVLFDLSAMTEEAKTVLCCATLLPTDGMDANLFRSCLKKEEQKALQNLVKQGWLSRTEELIKIHPIILAICQKELRPRISDCRPFLEQMNDHLEHSQSEKNKSQIIECFLNTDYRDFLREEDESSEYFNIATDILQKSAMTHIEQGDTIQGLLEALKIQEAVERFFRDYLEAPVLNLDAIGAYQSLVSIFLKFSADIKVDTEDAFSYYRKYWTKGLETQKRLFQRFQYIPTDPIFHNSDAINEVCYENAIRLDLENLRFRKTHLPDNISGLGTTYHFMASVYRSLDDKQKVLEYMLKRLFLYPQELQDADDVQKEVSDAFDLCQKILDAIDELEDPSERKALYLKLLEFDDSIFAAETSDYAKYCIRMGEICHEVQEYQTSMKYASAAAPLLEQFPLTDSREYARAVRVGRKSPHSGRKEMTNPVKKKSPTALVGDLWV